MADDTTQKSVDSLLAKRQTLDDKRKLIDIFRTTVLVLAVVFLSASIVAPFFIKNGRHATMAAVTGLGHSAILFAFVLVAGERIKNLTHHRVAAPINDAFPASTIAVVDPRT
jgi:hypothetical protein